jgi:hypothetical protein
MVDDVGKGIIHQDIIIRAKQYKQFFHADRGMPTVCEHAMFEQRIANSSLIMACYARTETCLFNLMHTRFLSFLGVGCFFMPPPPPPHTHTRARARTYAHIKIVVFLPFDNRCYKPVQLELSVSRVCQWLLFLMNRILNTF